jgi:hypothetical protein
MRQKSGPSPVGRMARRLERRHEGQTSRRSLRNAIYTRVSTEQGLEQDFNSLDAQREACEAYPPIYAFYSLLGTRVHPHGSGPTAGRRAPACGPCGRDQSDHLPRRAGGETSSP